jgi:hypothetical protein
MPRSRSGTACPGRVRPVSGRRRSRNPLPRRGRRAGVLGRSLERRDLSLGHMPRQPSVAGRAGTPVGVPVQWRAKRAVLRDAGVARSTIRLRARPLRAVSAPDSGQRRMGMRGDGRRGHLPIAFGGRRRSAWSPGRCLRLRPSRRARGAYLRRSLAGPSARPCFVELPRDLRRRLGGPRVHFGTGASRRWPVRIEPRLPGRHGVHRWPLPAG